MRAELVVSTIAQASIGMKSSGTYVLLTFGTFEASQILLQTKVSATKQDQSVQKAEIPITK